MQLATTRSMTRKVVAELRDLIPPQMEKWRSDSRPHVLASSAYQTCVADFDNLPMQPKNKIALQEDPLV